jgi:flagellar hook-length control protein FliK
MLTAKMAPLLTDKTNSTLTADDQYQQTDTEIAHIDHQALKQLSQLSQLIEKPAKKVLPSELNSSFPQNIIEKDDDQDELNVIQNVSVQKEESTLTNDHDITQIFAADKTAKTNQNDNNQYTQALSTLGYMIQELTTPTEKPLTQAKLTEPTFNDAKSAVMQANQLAEAPVSIDIMSALESVKKDVYTANIKIYPPELGSVIAKLKISKNIAELTLTTENDRVKQIVEANLPALRDHFIRSDLNLVSIDVRVHLANTDVGDQQPKQQADQQKPDTSMPRQEANQKTNNQTLVKKRLNSLVDTYV